MLAGHRPIVRSAPAAPLPVPVERGSRPPRVLVFDSGLGGLTVLAAAEQAMPGAIFTFAADDAVFPYGALGEDAVVSRVLAVVERLVAQLAPDAVVIACNTASTLVLPPLRARFPDLAIVGTVPAIKPAAAISRSRLISVLATPGTVARQYTRELVTRFAEDCTVTLVGAPRLAAFAEAAMRGEAVTDDDLRSETEAAFVSREGRRTDAVVLACTHYPLLLDRLSALAPWPVTWIDPAPAIARRLAQVCAERGFGGTTRLPGEAVTPVPAILTSGRSPGEPLGRFLAGRGLAVQPGERF